MLQPAVAAATVAAAGHPAAATGPLLNCRPVRGLFVIARQSRSFQTASGPSLPLLQGLQAVPGGASGLVGWQVAAKKGRRQHVPLGTVQQVDSIHPEGQGPAYQLLRVVQQTVLQPYGFKGQETHLLPLVPDIITAVHPQQKLLLADPPEGLLDLGRRDLLLSFLSQALLPYTPPAKGNRPAAAAAGLMAGAKALMQPREMPKRAALLAAGRADLVNLIMKVGGFTQAALQLGLRATRRPTGYWDSLEVLDMELDAFIAGCWVALPCPDDDAAAEGLPQDDAVPPRERQQSQQQQQHDDVYFYNTATKSIAWTLPDGLQQLFHPTASTASASPAAGGAAAADAVLSPLAYQALLDLQDERVMPPVSAVKEAGRWDLHNAITQHGGYAAVAAELERRQCNALPEDLLTPKGLKAALRQLSLEEGWDPQRLPTAQQLRDLDRQDLVRAINDMGGWHAVAQELKLANIKTTDKAWQAWSIQDLTHELHLFMAQHNNSPGAATSPAAAVNAAGCQSAASSEPGGRQKTQRQQQQQPSDAYSSSRLSQLVRHRRQQQLQQAEPPSDLQPAAQQDQQRLHAAQVKHLPTQAELVSAGRLDIVYSLRRHGYDAVQQHMGLEGRYRKPKRKGVLQWPAVEAAVAAGCHNCLDILAHISTQQLLLQQPSGSQAAAAAIGSETQAAAAPVQLLGAPQAVAVVSREHLQRQLKAWVNEGRLVKVAHNCFKLPSQCC